MSHDGYLPDGTAHEDLDDEERPPPCAALGDTTEACAQAGCLACMLELAIAECEAQLLYKGEP